MSCYTLCFQYLGFLAVVLFVPGVIVARWVTNNDKSVSISRSLRHLSRSITTFLEKYSAMVHPFLQTLSNGCIDLAQMTSIPLLHHLASLNWIARPLSNGVKCSYCAQTRIQVFPTVKVSTHNVIRMEFMR